MRRWFKQHYGITFQAFQRMYRINQALLELKGGRNATDTAFESLSSFGYTYKKVIGSSPKHGKSKRVILLNRLTTPLGPMIVCANNKGICLLEFVDKSMLDTEFKDLQKLLGATLVAGENQHIRQAGMEVAEYFEGSRQTFTLSLDTTGTAFQNLVWESLRQIPYGETRSYQQQAEVVGTPAAVRAVASANGHSLYLVTGSLAKTANWWGIAVVWSGSNGCWSMKNSTPVLSRSFNKSATPPASPACL